MKVRTIYSVLLSIALMVAMFSVLTSPALAADAHDISLSLTPTYQDGNLTLTLSASWTESLASNDFLTFDITLDDQALATGTVSGTEASVLSGRSGSCYKWVLGNTTSPASMSVSWSSQNIADGSHFISLRAASSNGNKWGAFAVDGTSVPTSTSPIFSAATLEIGSSGSGGSGDSTLTVANNFTEPNSDYFSTAEITVTPSESDLSFTVACNNACVVAKVDGDTYTRMTGTALEGGGYSFTADSASDQFVVVVKGDLNSDGETNGTDASQVDRYEAGLRNLTALQVLACDINGDGEANGTDAAQLKRVEAGLRSFAWDV